MKAPRRERCVFGLRAQVIEINVSLLITATTVTSKPAMTALAGLVHWAELGIRQM